MITVRSRFRSTSPMSGIPSWALPSVLLGLLLAGCDPLVIHHVQIDPPDTPVATTQAVTVQAEVADAADQIVAALASRYGFQKAPLWEGDLPGTRHMYVYRRTGRSSGPRSDIRITTRSSVVTRDIEIEIVEGPAWGESDLTMQLRKELVHRLKERFGADAVRPLRQRVKQLCPATAP